MVSQERSPHPTSQPPEPPAAPRISFSSDFVNGQIVISREAAGPPVAYSPDFEFLAGDRSEITMLPADELFCEGRLLPFWPPHISDKLGNASIALKPRAATGEDEEKPKGGASWFVDDDPSPRPPKCTVLWKELLKLRRQQSAAAEGERKKKGLARTRSATMRFRPALRMPICTQGRSNSLPF